MRASLDDGFADCDGITGRFHMSGLYLNLTFFLGLKTPTGRKHPNILCAAFRVSVEYKPFSERSTSKMGTWTLWDVKFTHTLRLKTAPKPYIIWSLDPNTLNLNHRVLRALGKTLEAKLFASSPGRLCFRWCKWHLLARWRGVS